MLVLMSSLRVDFFFSRAIELYVHLKEKAENSRFASRHAAHVPQNAACIYFPLVGGEDVEDVDIHNGAR